MGSVRMSRSCLFSAGSSEPQAWALDPEISCSRGGGEPVASSGPRGWGRRPVCSLTPPEHGPAAMAGAKFAFQTPWGLPSWGVGTSWSRQGGLHTSATSQHLRAAVRPVMAACTDVARASVPVWAWERGARDEKSWGGGPALKAATQNVPAHRQNLPRSEDRNCPRGIVVPFTEHVTDSAWRPRLGHA